ncbi:ATP-binding domain-containing protein [Bradyrhizobium sp. SZCCHNR1051]|uniref:ATP-binding domain-containing protein n=1 Tax=Bradyrhizobium sp. SZCCHNR1051 TaxID=3057355 RepID=UPI002916BA9F|nr:ATP-binding domain-containing protein [Bradyrhizobium sp. SZCCHNR1051]
MSGADEQERTSVQGEASRQDEHLVELANHTLTFFEDVSNAARERLGAQGGRPLGDAGVFAAVNTLTADRALQNLTGINKELLRELSQLVTEPAIARIVLRDEDGGERVYFIARAGTLPTSKGLMASYRSPIGRLAALRVGHDEDVRTPQGIRNYELRERATLRPAFKADGWDSINTVLHAVRSKPLTLKSLRQLLIEAHQDEIDYLESLLAEGRAAENVLEGIRRDVRKKMGLRDQPLLNEIQDSIFRMPINSRLAVLGPPGTGKTTTLIKRLGQKLDTQYLEDEERRIIAGTTAGSDRHSQSWMMFTPTELLKQYVKEAFALEEIAASDDRIKTWSDYSRDVARNKLGVLRTEANNGLFKLRPALESLQLTTLVRQIDWFEDFENWQAKEFWRELGIHADTLATNSGRDIARLGARLGNIVKGDSSPGDKLLTIGSAKEELQALANGLHSLTDDKIRRGLGQLFKQTPDIVTRLMQFVATLDDGSEDIDDLDADEDEDHRRPADRAAAIDACIRAARAQARAALSGRTLGKATRHGRLIEFLGGRILSPEELKAVGLNLQVQTAARRFMAPLGRFVSGVPRRYRSFRKERQAEGHWYKADGFGVTDISPLEVDVVLLTLLRASRHLLRNVGISNNIEDSGYAVLRAVENLFRTQIVVDEATDFSPIQLACMARLCDPAAESFFACGDFNQRITTWGTRSAEELKWAVPNISILPINISYRHTQQLNELAHKIALISNPSAERAALPEDVINDGVKPVLLKGASGRSQLSEWLAERIGEIERFTGSMPSIAVLVNTEMEVEPLAKALDAALADRSLRAVACLRGQTVGQDNDVRVFDVQHIKGLEFEAVFFVGVDELAERMPDLFDKYLYVGTTRAATFLGVTVNGPALPDAIKSLEGLFQDRWLS